MIFGAIIVGLVGIAIGIALHRWFIAFSIGKFPMTMCHYCEWHRQKREMHIHYRQFKKEKKPQ